MSICLSVHSLHAGIVSKRLNISLNFFHHYSSFSVPNIEAMFGRRLPNDGRQMQVEYETRKSSVDEVGERYRLNHAIVVKLYQPYTQFIRNVCLSHRRVVLWRFRLLRLINTIKYLLTYLLISSLLITIYSSSTLYEVVRKHLLQLRECYSGRPTQMKAYDKYVEYWRDLEIWLRWSFKVTENGADGHIHLTWTVNLHGHLERFRIFRRILLQTVPSDASPGAIMQK